MVFAPPSANNLVLPGYGGAPRPTVSKRSSPSDADEALHKLYLRWRDAIGQRSLACDAHRADAKRMPAAPSTIASGGYACLWLVCTTGLNDE